MFYHKLATLYKYVSTFISDLQCKKATDWSDDRVYDLVYPGRSRISGEAPDDPVTSQGNPQM